MTFCLECLEKGGILVLRYSLPNYTAFRRCPKEYAVNHWRLARLKNCYTRSKQAIYDYRGIVMTNAKTLTEHVISFSKGKNIEYKVPGR